MDEARVDREPAGSGQVAVFGAFELRLDTGELRKHGVRVRLQGKPFQILTALIHSAGHVVTREDLRTKLWPSNTFVDFESGLNTAVNRLRIALGDSAESPIYVETLARIGYRFIAPVRVTSLGGPAASAQIAESMRASSAAHPPVVPNPDASSAQSARRLTLKKSHAIAGLVVLILLLAGIGISANHLFRPRPAFHQLTFARGIVSNARFMPNGREVVYSAAWNGEPSRLFSTNVAHPESRNLGSRTAWLVDASPAGDIAFLEHSKDAGNALLESVPIRGGNPHMISDHAKGADWSQRGVLCLVTEKDAGYAVEYPPGRTLYASKGWISNADVSPSGDQVALVEHPIPNDDAGQVVLLDSSGHARVLTSGWGSVEGLAWHPTEREIWFTAARTGVDRNLMAVDINGHLREVGEIPGGMELLDIARSGDVLISRNTPRMMMLFGQIGGLPAQDISLLDWSRAVAISANGKWILFDESGAGGGKQYSVYLYGADTRSSTLLGEGRALDLSSNGRWALSQAANDIAKLSLISVDDRKSKLISNHGFQYRWAKFLPGSECPEILFEGNRSGEKPQLYRQELPDGNPQAVGGGASLMNAAIDENARLVVGSQGDSIAVVDLANGSSRSIRTSTRVFPVAFVNPREVLTRYADNGSIMLDVLNLQTGTLRPYHRLDFTDVTGTAEIFPICVTKDLRTFVYSRLNTLSDLYSVSGWR
jgi:DNA-binding winged helix-turn-helix (wHTH) protein